MGYRTLDATSDLSDLTSRDTFDSREVEDWIDELESAQDDYREKASAADPDNPVSEDEHEDFENRRDILKALIELRDECSMEWASGITFISDSYFEEYAQQFAEDCGYTGNGRGSDNPLLDYVDWKKWARDFQIDYFSVDVDGFTFYYRD